MLAVMKYYEISLQVNIKEFKQRLIKICIHEVGHNLGLKHCVYDPKCLMNDANGTISQVDREGMYFCKKCKRQVESLYIH